MSNLQLSEWRYDRQVILPRGYIEILANKELIVILNILEKEERGINKYSLSVAFVNPDGILGEFSEPIVVMADKELYFPEGIKRVFLYKRKVYFLGLRGNRILSLNVNDKGNFDSLLREEGTLPISLNNVNYTYLSYIQDGTIYLYEVHNQNSDAYSSVIKEDGTLSEWSKINRLERKIITPTLDFFKHSYTHGVLSINIITIDKYAYIFEEQEGICDNRVITIYYSNVVK